MQFLKWTHVTDNHFFMGHCVGGTGLQCQSWRDDLVHQFSKTMPLKTVKQEWCETVFTDLAGGQSTQKSKTSASKRTIVPEGNKSRVELTNHQMETPPSTTITSTSKPQIGSPSNSSKFLASQPAHGGDVSYKLEVDGQNCGLQAHGTYSSTSDDAETCKSKCSADKACLSYTTYVSKVCELKCLHYSHSCDEKHRASTQCEGDIKSYSKVFNPVSSKSVDTPKTSTNLHKKPTQTTGNQTKTKATQAMGTAMKKSQPIRVVGKEPQPSEKAVKVVKAVKAVKAAKAEDLKEDTVLPTAQTAVKDVTSTKHHKSWKDFLPKSTAVPKANGSKKDCACVHRHGKEVCHCLGEQDQSNKEPVHKNKHVAKNQ